MAWNVVRMAKRAQLLFMGQSRLVGVALCWLRSPADFATMLLRYHHGEITTVIVLWVEESQLRGW